MTVLSTSPQRHEEERSPGGVRIVRAREIHSPLLTRFNLVRPETGFALVCRRFLRRNSFDVIHCLYHADVVGAMWQESARRTPCVFHMTGIPFDRWIRRHPWETAMTRAAISHASRVVLASRYATDRFGRSFPQYAGKTVALGIPCRVECFNRVQVPRDMGRPVILFMGTLAEFRKGAHTLARAFNRVKQDLPCARLRYSGGAADAAKASVLACVLPEFRNDIEFLGPGRLEDLPLMYAQASVTVLPSVEEAFGMALVESLAAGTPVVGSADAGMSDIVEPGTGILVDPLPKNGIATNVAGFAGAIMAAIRLHADPLLAGRCRTSALRFAWECLGPRFETIYEEIAL